jgi:hypothetical protein
MVEKKKDRPSVDDVIKRCQLILELYGGNVCANLKGADEMKAKVDALVKVLP